VAGTFSMFKEASIADSRQKLTPTGDDEVSESSQLGKANFVGRENDERVA